MGRHILHVLVLGWLSATTAFLPDSPPAQRYGIFKGASMAPATLRPKNEATSLIPAVPSRARNMKNTMVLQMDTGSVLMEVASSSWLSEVPNSPEPIHTAFSAATFFPQPFWLLLILLPNAKVTKQIMGGLEVIGLCCVVHFFIVVSSIVTGGAEATAPIGIFADVFDTSGDPQAAFLRLSEYPNFVAEEWSHVLTWDLFVGRYIWLDGLSRNIPTRLSVLFCNLIGPPGLLIHFATCAFQGKPLVELEQPKE